jgi:hypothetical protein
MAVSVIVATVASFAGASLASAALIGLSVSYQLRQSAKMRARMKAAAEARRGIDVVTESEVVSIPIIYGRAKVGGIRVWAQTRSALFNLTNLSSSSVTVIGTPLTGTQPGSKNEYLVMQQVLCQGPIGGFYDFDINDNDYYNNSEFKNIYAECHPFGGLNQNIAKNFSDRITADFTGLAYANITVKVDRDNPKDIPNIAFFIEGRKVRNITRSGSAPNYSYSVTADRVYSNNPALCLLDYLLEDTSNPVLNISTKALNISEIDLESFYNAKVLCDKTVQSNVSVGGKIWKPTNGSRSISYRDVPLYECNVVLDTDAPIRDNIEMILGTMGDARLVWSLGKYKLLLQYPGA